MNSSDCICPSFENLFAQKISDSIEESGKFFNNLNLVIVNFFKKTRNEIKPYFNDFADQFEHYSANFTNKVNDFIVETESEHVMFVFIWFLLIFIIYREYQHRLQYNTMVMETILLTLPIQSEIPHIEPLKKPEIPQAEPSSKIPKIPQAEPSSKELTETAPVVKKCGPKSFLKFSETKPMNKLDTPAISPIKQKPKSQKVIKFADDINESRPRIFCSEDECESDSDFIPDYSEDEDSEELELERSIAEKLAKKRKTTL